MRSDSFALDGGDVLALRHWDPPDGALSRARILLVHGLGGGPERPYMLRAARHFLPRGYAVSALGMRRTATGAGRYHLGLYEDIELALSHMPDAGRPLFLIGFSGGGSVVLNFLARSVLADRIRAAACMSAPLDLRRLGRHVEEQAPFYHRHLVGGLGAGELADLKPYASLSDFDMRVLCARYGFSSVEDYRRRASAGPVVSQISTPTLLLEAADDPVVPAALNDAYAKAVSASVTRVVTARGGHIGWVQSARDLLGADTWGLRRVGAFFAQTQAFEL